MITLDEHLYLQTREGFSEQMEHYNNIQEMLEDEAELAVEEWKYENFSNETFIIFYDSL